MDALHDQGSNTGDNFQQETTLTATYSTYLTGMDVNLLQRYYFIEGKLKKNLLFTIWNKKTRIV